MSLQRTASARPAESSDVEPDGGRSPQRSHITHLASTHTPGVMTTATMTARACACCGIKLSRYNTERVCGACSANRSRMIVDIPNVKMTEVGPDFGTGEALRNWRRNHHLTQRAMARLLGISEHYLVHLESGRGHLSVAQRWYLVEELGISPQDLGLTRPLPRRLMRRCDTCGTRTVHTLDGLCQQCEPTATSALPSPTVKMTEVGEDNGAGRALQAWRKAHNLTQSVLALILGISESYLAKIEEGKGHLSAEQRWYLVETLGLKPEHLGLTRPLPRTKEVTTS